jgi:[ribosomal protein S5]-alanine N-acetyltransferase
MNKVLIENSKIYIRKLSLKDDLNSYLSWINDKDTTLYLRKRKKQTISDLKDYIQYNLNSSNYLCGIFKKTDDTHIGNILLSHIDNDNKNCDIGIFVGKESWGKGIGTLAIVLMCKYAFSTLKMHKVIAGVVKENIGSSKLFEKAGFILEGVKKEEFKFDNEFLDTLHYGKINENI